MFEITDSKAQFPSAAFGDPWETLMPCLFALAMALLIINVSSICEELIEQKGCFEGGLSEAEEDEEETSYGGVGSFMGDFLFLLLGILLQKMILEDVQTNLQESKEMKSREEETSWGRHEPSSAQAWLKMLTAMMKALIF